MMVAGWLLLGSLVWWFFDGQVERRDNPNAELAQVAGPRTEVILKRGRDGHYRAPGRIDGHPVEFLVDTGATMVALPESLARSIGLRPGRAFTARTANGTTVAHATRLQQVTLGGLEVRDVAGAILSGAPANELADEQVLLGMSFLSHFEISIRDGEMRLHGRAPGP